MHRDNRAKDASAWVDKLSGFVPMTLIAQIVFERDSRDVVGRGIYVDEDGCSTDARDAAGGRKKCVGGRQNRIARSNFQRHENGEKRIRAGGNSNRMRHVAVVGDCALKSLHL